MSAECHKCGADIVYPEGTWPIGECPECGLRERVAELEAQVAEQQNIIEWWANSFAQQVERKREALVALGVRDAVNYTGEVRNFIADSLYERLAASPVPEEQPQ